MNDRLTRARPTSAAYTMARAMSNADRRARVPGRDLDRARCGSPGSRRRRRRTRPRCRASRSARPRRSAPPSRPPPPCRARRSRRTTGSDRRDVDAELDARARGERRFAARDGWDRSRCPQWRAGATRSPSIATTPRAHARRRRRRRRRRPPRPALARPHCRVSRSSGSSGQGRSWPSRCSRTFRRNDRVPARAVRFAPPRGHRDRWRDLGERLLGGERVRRPRGDTRGRGRARSDTDVKSRWGVWGDFQ